MKYWLALSLALTLNATANLMMKFGVNRFKPRGFPMDEGIGAMLTAVVGNWVLLLGLSCFVINVVFYAYALSGLKISVAYPIMFCGGVAIIVLIAFLFLHERLSAVQWVGLVCIVVGVILVSRNGQVALGQ